MRKTDAISIMVIVSAMAAIIGWTMFAAAQHRYAKTKAECEKREALIRQADEYADSVEKTLDAERQRRAELEYEHEELLKKYNAVRRGGKRAKDYEKLPDSARADSLRDGILRAVRQ